jgi:hypothetical protein
MAGGRSPGAPRPGTATVTLDAEPSSILDFEDFVDGLDFLSAPERARMKIAGGELLDNIVKHSSPVAEFRIYARASRRDSRRGPAVLLSLFFRSPSFAAFAARSPSLDSAPEPLFDPDNRRWRGIGLAMCRNLARRVAFRPGGRMDRIFVEFDAEPGPGGA